MKILLFFEKYVEVHRKIPSQMSLQVRRSNYCYRSILFHYLPRTNLSNIMYKNWSKDLEILGFIAKWLNSCLWYSMTATWDKASYHHSPTHAAMKSSPQSLRERQRLRERKRDRDTENAQCCVNCTQFCAISCVGCLLLLSSQLLAHNILLFWNENDVHRAQQNPTNSNNTHPANEWIVVLKTFATGLRLD